MSEGTGFLLVVLLVSATILAIVISGNLHEENMAKLGYTEVQAVGTTDTLWVKP